MSESSERTANLPDEQCLRGAIELYLERAYEVVPDAVRERFLPSPSLDPAKYLMEDFVERTPAEAGLEEVRVFALRLGNAQYPNMKLRIARPPNDAIYLFSVDCHDGMLQVPETSPDFEPLEQLKKYNASLAGDIDAAWEESGLVTEKVYLRHRIRQARVMDAGRNEYREKA